MAKGKARRNSVVAKILADAREAATARRVDALIGRFDDGEALAGDEAELVELLAMTEARVSAGEVT